MIINAKCQLNVTIKIQSVKVSNFQYLKYQANPQLRIKEFVIGFLFNSNMLFKNPPKKCGPFILVIRKKLYYCWKTLKHWKKNTRGKRWNLIKNWANTTDVMIIYILDWALFLIWKNNIYREYISIFLYRRYLSNIIRQQSNKTKSLIGFLVEYWMNE